MLSSVNDDKPVVASTWLDRLRLSKGHSTTTDKEDASGTPLTLDDFLRRSNNHTTISPSDSPPTPSESPEWYGAMSDVLSELFNFGESSSSRSNTKKLPRKQTNPRHCCIETPLVVGSSCSEKLDPLEIRERRRRRRSVVVEVEEEDEEEEGEKELVGFSKSEVTVIDTSFGVWKSEKLVFRRRNVWKVREKKGKGKAVSLKKKKMKMKMKMKKEKKKNRECDVGDGEISRTKKKRKVSDNVSVSFVCFP